MQSGLIRNCDEPVTQATEGQIYRYDAALDARSWPELVMNLEGV